MWTRAVDLAWNRCQCVSNAMKVFVSCQSVDSVSVQSLIRRLIAIGLAVDHSPRNPLDGEDSRWSDWYKHSLPAAIAAANCFLIVVDGGWDSSSWMGEEARMAEESGLPMYFWNPDRIQVKGMLHYLKLQLPDDLADAVRHLRAAAETKQSDLPRPPITRELES